MFPASNPTQTHTPDAGDGLTADDVRMIRAANARHFAEERARDARRLAAYERECLASWEVQE